MNTKQKIYNQTKIFFKPKFMTKFLLMKKQMRALSTWCLFAFLALANYQANAQCAPGCTSPGIAPSIGLPAFIKADCNALPLTGPTSAIDMLVTNPGGCLPAPTVQYLQADGVTYAPAFFAKGDNVATCFLVPNTTWTITVKVTNCAGVSTSATTQIITITDEFAPVVDAASVPVNVTHECDGTVPASAPDPTFTDCDPAVIVSKTQVDALDACGLGTITYSWTGTDCSGNVTAPVVQAITIVDTKAPIWAAAGAVPAPIQCAKPFVAPVAPANPTATDLCDAAPVVSAPVVVNNLNACGTGTISYTWTATDCAGNSVDSTLTILVIDNVAPDITLVTDNADADGNFSCETLPVVADPTLSGTEDGCDLTPALLHTINASGLNACGLGTIVHTWTLTDCSGNVSAPLVHTYVIEDIILPVLTSSPLSDVTVQCGDPLPVFLAPKFTDNCGTPVVTFAKVDVLDACGIGTSTHTWTAKDCFGNETIEDVIVTIIDTQGPFAQAGTIFNPNPIIVNCNTGGVVPKPVFLDRCGKPTTLVETIVSGGPLVCGAGTYTVVYSAVDCSGNPSAALQDVVQIVTIAPDTQAPVWASVAGSLDITVECPAVAAVIPPTATDACSSTPVAYTTVITPPTPGTCPGLYIETRTYTASDCAGNISTPFVIKITHKDVTPPTVLTSVLTPVVISCGGAASAPNTASVVGEADACDPAPVVTWVSDTPTGTSTCAGLTNFTRTYKVQDCAGNFVLVTQGFITVDIIKPVFTALPAAGSLNFTSNCNGGVDWTAAETVLAALANDNCQLTAEKINVKSETMAGACSPKTITRVYEAKDCSGNVSVATFTVVASITDAGAPVVVEAAGALDGTFACGTMAMWVAPTFIDGCDITPLTVTFVTNPAVINACGLKTIVRVYTAKDCANNTSLGYNVTMVETDNVGPVVSPIASIGVTCGSPAPLPNTTLVTATDACGGSVVIAFVSDNNLPGLCSSTIITRTYSATDCSGNVTFATQTITSIDTVPPVATITPSAITVSCGAVPVANTSIVSATDNCTSVADLTTVLFSELIVGTCEGNQVITRTYRVTDCAGNTADVTQTITKVDTNAPTWISSIGAFNGTYACGTSPVWGSPIAIDGCDLILPISSFTDDVPVAVGTCGLQSITRRYRSTDCAGNVSVVYLVTMTEKDDTKPVISVTSGSLDAVNVECSTPAILPTLEATDTGCGAASVAVVVTGPVVTGPLSACGLGTQIFTWTATDCSGNISTVTKSITIVDSIAPTFDMAAPANVVLECGDAIPTPMIMTATDACNAPSVTSIDSTFAGTTCGSSTIKRTWIAVDCGGLSTSVFQLITISDNTAPVIEAAPDNISLVCGQALPAAAMLMASDACDLSVVVTVEDVTVLGTVCGSSVTTRTWSATDCANNSATSVTQIITISDVLAPVFDASTPSTITGECTANAVAPSITDNCDVASVLSSVIDNSGITSCGTGTRIITWTATDCANNTSTFVQSVTITDATAPMIMDVPANITIACGSALPFATDLVAMDGCDTGVDTAFVTSVTTFNAITGLSIITNTWVAIDCSGNTATAVQVINVIDTVAPMFNEAVPADLNLVCTDTVPVAVILSAMDVCDLNTILVVYNESTSAYDCATGVSVITRTWSGTDASNNVVSHTQTITITCPSNNPNPGTYGPICDAAAPIMLNGSPAGGVWTGAGVTAAMFNPSATSVVIGNNILTYTYIDANGCSKSANTVVVVNDCPASVVGAVDPCFCIDDAKFGVVLSVTASSLPITFSGVSSSIVGGLANGNSYDATSPAVTMTAPGVYTLQLSIQVLNGLNYSWTANDADSTTAAFTYNGTPCACGSGSISGIVWFDVDTSKTLNAGDYGLINQQIFISEPFTDANNNGIWEVGEAYQDLNSDGSFTNSWMLDTTASSSEVYADANSNGTYDGPDTFTDSNGNGVYDASVAAESYTDSNGDSLYTPAFTGEPFIDANGDGLLSPAVAGEVFIDADSSGTWSANDGKFTDVNGDGVYTAGTDTFIDANGDGIFTPEEAYLDVNGNNTFDAAIPAETFTDTNGNGVYNGPTPAESFTDTNGDGIWSNSYSESYVDVNANGAYNSTGEVFVDTNGDGVYTAQGSYFFDNLPDGDYVVTYNVNAPYTNVSEFSPNFQTVSVTAGQNTIVAVNYLAYGPQAVSSQFTAVSVADNCNYLTFVWTMENEASVMKYMVQRSEDAINFTTLAEVAANTNAAHTYSFNDYSVQAAGYYYRVVAVTGAGTQSLSSLSFGKSTCQYAINVTNLFPNPAVNNVSLTIASSYAANLVFEVRDVTGRIVIAENSAIIAGTNIVNINIAALANANYFMNVREVSGTQIDMLKFTKSNN